MKQSKFCARAGALATGASLVAMLAASGLGGSNVARADDDDFFFGLLPGNLLVSRSVYDNQGADPNKLVTITDNLAATTLPASESFKTVDSARFAEVLRGVSFTPGSHGDCDHDDDHRCDRH
jgi:hypothetical protein